MWNEGLARRLNDKLYRLFAALILLEVVLSAFAPMLNQVDLGWQIAQGRWVVHHHFAPYRHDLFSYANLGRPVINEYPLFEIILYAFACLGWWGPSLLAAVVYAGLILILLGAGRALQLGDSALLAGATGLMLLFFQVAFPLRPHVATYLGVTTLGAFLLRHRDAGSWIVFWPMALLQIAWTNCHSGFVLGPVMAALFGAEVCLRLGLREMAFPVRACRTWLGATLLLLLACLVNPSGWDRFYPPLFQDRLESIRAYVGEMEPLRGGLATIYGYLTAAAVLVVGLAMIRRRGAVSFSFLLVALLLFAEAHGANKAWPVFGLFIPLLVLSAAAFRATPAKQGGWPSTFALFTVVVLVASALIARVDPASHSSVAAQWKQYDEGRTEMPIDATKWLRAHAITGRLFHRCEDGGWLQMSGYDRGETFSDTGFGKYDEAFIHEVGLVNERPATLPHFIAAYDPDYIVCNNFCFQWPAYLKAYGWRLVFFSPNSSVWVRPKSATFVPAISSNDVMAAFDHDLAVNGLPDDVRLFGRNLVMLNSMGLEEFSFAKLTGLAPELHHAPWYWEAARLMCFGEPALSDEHRTALEREAEGLHDDAVTADFRAHVSESAGDSDGALRSLQAVSASALSDSEATLLLKIELARKQPEALALARRTDCFELRNGEHWQYLAQAEQGAGNIAAASAAWRKAVFYYPDDALLVSAANDFAVAQKDESLRQAIATRFDFDRSLGGYFQW